MGGTRLIDRVRGAQGKLPGASPLGRPSATGPAGEPVGADFQKIRTDLQNEIIDSLDFEQVEHPAAARRSRRSSGPRSRSASRRGSLPAQPDGARAARRGDPRQHPRARPARTASPRPRGLDIMINGPEYGLHRAQGQVVLTNINVSSTTTSHLMQIIERIVSAVGRRVDETEPDGRRPHDGRIAVQRDHPAVSRSTGPLRLDPPVRHHPDHRRGPGRARLVPASDARGPPRRGASRS